MSEWGRKRGRKTRNHRNKRDKTKKRSSFQAHESFRKTSKPRILYATRSSRDRTKSHAACRDEFLTKSSTSQPPFVRFIYVYIYKQASNTHTQKLLHTQTHLQQTIKQTYWYPTNKPNIQTKVIAGMWLYITNVALGIVGWVAWQFFEKLGGVENWGFKNFSNKIGF